jgi:CheY-like chemotaxis protein
MHKIAIIEDADDNRDLLYYILRDEFDVVRYSTGEDALRHFSEQVPELIILDIWLPGLDGVEVLRRIRQEDRLRRIPVLALTANAMIGDREKYLAVGFDGYMPKPILDLNAFIQTIRTLLDARRC